MATTRSRAANVGAAGTAIGTACKSTLANVDARDLAKPVVMAAIERSGLDATDFEDRASAEVLQGGGDMAGYGAARVSAWATLIAATSARMVTSAVYDLRGGGIGVLSMCAGCGMGARR